MKENAGYKEVCEPTPALTQSLCWHQQGMKLSGNRSEGRVWQERNMCSFISQKNIIVLPAPPPEAPFLIHEINTIVFCSSSFNQALLPQWLLQCSACGSAHGGSGRQLSASSFSSPPYLLTLPPAAPLMHDVHPPSLLLSILFPLLLCYQFGGSPVITFSLDPFYPHTSFSSSQEERGLLQVYFPDQLPVDKELCNIQWAFTDCKGKQVCSDLQEDKAGITVSSLDKGVLLDNQLTAASAVERVNSCT